MRIGIDIDGVLADFQPHFVALFVRLTGRDLYPQGSYAERYPNWNHPQHWGYTDEEVAQVWAAINNDPSFWLNLPDYPETQAAIEYLSACQARGDFLFFVTNRSGVSPARQTEQWLMERLIVNPFVIVSSKKGLVAQQLQLDVYIDDNRENAIDAAIMTAELDGSNQTCKVCLLNRPWNQDPLPEMLPEGAILRTDTLVGIAD